MHRFLVLGSILFFLLYPAGRAQAESPGALVKKGNNAYSEEKYDDALLSYEKALEEIPDSPEVLFNKGAAHYKKGEFDEAKDAFEQSASKAEDKHLEAVARFNQGNAFYRKAERLIPSDLSGALENCKKSIKNYQEALELDPDFKEAAENMETGRLMMKSILEKMEEQKNQSGNENQKQNQDKDQNQEQDAEDNKTGETDKSKTGEGKPEGQENSGENQPGHPEDENQNKPEKGKQEQPKRDGLETDSDDISDTMKVDAESILDEEKKNKERRRARIQGRFSGVDRDW